MLHNMTNVFLRQNSYLLGAAIQAYNFSVFVKGTKLNYIIKRF